MTGVVKPEPPAVIPAPSQPPSRQLPPNLIGGGSAHPRQSQPSCQQQQQHTQQRQSTQHAQHQPVPPHTQEWFPNRPQQPQQQQPACVRQPLLQRRCEQGDGDGQGSVSVHPHERPGPGSSPNPKRVCLPTAVASSDATAPADALCPAAHFNTFALPQTSTTAWVKKRSSTTAQVSRLSAGRR